MFSDSARDGCPSEASGTCSAPGRVYQLKQRLGSWAVHFVDVRWILRGARVFGESGSPWYVIEASTVALPSIGMEMGDSSRHRRVLVRCSPFQGSMRAMIVKVCPEIEQLVFEIRSGPEQGAIQILTSNRAGSRSTKG